MRVLPHWGARALMAAPPLAMLVALSVLPLVRLVAYGWDAGSLALLVDAYFLSRIAWSLAQAAITCVLCALVGVPIAWVLARTEFAGRGLLLRLLLLPFVMPTLVAAMGVLALFGPTGYAGVNLAGTPALLLYGNLFFNLPLLVRAGVDGFAALPAARLDAARSLGASPWRAFWRVELPTVLPHLAAALCLVFLYCFSGFGLALLLGGQRWATVEVEIYTLIAYELNLADAGVLALSALAVTALCALAYAVLERRLAVPSRIQPVARTAAKSTGARLRLAATLGALGLFCAAPLVALLLRALVALPGQASLLLDEETLAALANTLRFSLQALLLAVPLGLLHALAAKGGSLMRAAAFLPFIVSPVCMAFGILLLYPAWTASQGVLVACYALFAYPFIARGLASALDAIPGSLTDAARTLGATPWRSFRRLTWPLLSGAFARALSFAAATCVGEFAVTLFLSRPEWTTLTTLIYQKLGRPGAANLDAALILSALLMLFALAAFMVIERKDAHAATH